MHRHPSPPQRQEGGLLRALLHLDLRAVLLVELHHGQGGEAAVGGHRAGALPEEVGATVPTDGGVPN